MTAQLQTMRCLACGSELVYLEGKDVYRCKRCGEVYDLRGLSKMELELEEFDRLLLYSLKKKRGRIVNRI